MAHWVIEKTPDFILTSLYIVLLVRLRTASNKVFKTPFFTFFFTSGICGIGTVYSNIFAEKIIYNKQFIWIHVMLCIVSQTCAIGSTIGKLMMVVHRYRVIHSGDLSENTWTTFIVRVTITSQFLIGMICSIPIPFYGYRYIIIDCIDVMVAQDPTGVIIQKSITNVFYIGYIIISVVLTVITGRKLRELSELATEATRQKAMKQQRNMYIIVLFCCASHVIKALNQLLWAGAAYFDQAMLIDNVVRPVFPFVNGLATYTAPLTFLLLSSALRSLFRCPSFQFSRVSSTTQSAPDEIRTSDERNRQE